MIASLLEPSRRIWRLVSSSLLCLDFAIAIGSLCEARPHWLALPLCNFSLSVLLPSVKPRPKPSVFNPILLDFVAGGMQAGSDPVQHDLAMLPHPDFVHGLD
jgi:hypothetical protein